MSKGRPAAEVEIDADLVRELVARQHPDLADHPVREGGEGWDCALFRIGDDLAARLPRRASAVPLLAVERRWLPVLAPQLPTPVPTPLRPGEPSDRFPWPWCLVPWFEGRSADVAPLDASAAVELAAFLDALHRPAPDDAPRNAWRGVPLGDRIDAAFEWLDALAADGGIDGAVDRGARALLHRAAETPIDVVPTWLHGDLHPRNVVTRAGRLAAVVDWGDVCVGDRATDLAALWLLLPTPDSRATARRALEAARDVSSDTWARARGWAVFFGAILGCSGIADGDPAFAAAGIETLRRVTAV